MCLNLDGGTRHELCDEGGYAHPVLNRVAIKGEDTLRKAIKMIKTNSMKIEYLGDVCC